MNAIKLRNVLLGLIGLLIILIGVVIYYAHGFLQQEALKTSHAKIDAELSDRDIERLKSLQRILADNQESVEKAQQIVAATQQYQYQDQIIKDINSYAAKTGVSVLAYDFGSINDTSTTRTPSANTVPGVKSIAATITLKSPIPFDNYLRFLKAIEQNLTKMQVSGVNLAPATGDINGVVNPSVGLIVYVR